MTHSLSADEFDAKVLQCSDLVLVDFWAPWCGPCQVLGPIVDEIAADAPAGVQVFKVNVDQSAELASQYGIMSIPAIKIFKNGEVVDEATGNQSKQDLLDLIAKNQ